MTDAADDRRYESLNGWWHTWLDQTVDWEREAPIPPGTRALDLPARAPSAGWGGKEATRAPGTLDQARDGVLHLDGEALASRQQVVETVPGGGSAPLTPAEAERGVAEA